MTLLKSEAVSLTLLWFVGGFSLRKQMPGFKREEDHLPCAWDKVWIQSPQLYCSSQIQQEDRKQSHFKTLTQTQTKPTPPNLFGWPDARYGAWLAARAALRHWARRRASLWSALSHSWQLSSWAQLTGLVTAPLCFCALDPTKLKNWGAKLRMLMCSKMTEAVRASCCCPASRKPFPSSPWIWSLLSHTDLYG